MTSVKELLASFPCKEQTGIVVPSCDGKYFVRLRHTNIKEFIAIYMLYEYQTNRKWLPQTIIQSTKVPDSNGSKAYEEMMLSFLQHLSIDRNHFFQGKLYTHYTSELRELLGDLHEGGNKHVEQEMALELWIHYRAMFPDEAFSTHNVVEANPRLANLYDIVYAGPILF